MKSANGSLRTARRHGWRLPDRLNGERGQSTLLNKCTLTPLARGAVKIAAELNEQGYPCGRHKVARLMRIVGLKGCPKTTFKVTTERDPSHPVADNLLAQDLTAAGPNQRWASDITYISTYQGWLYLAVVMDLYSPRIVGWSMGRFIIRTAATSIRAMISMKNSRSTAYSAA